MKNYKATVWLCGPPPTKENAPTLYKHTHTPVSIYTYYVDVGEVFI